MRLGSDCRALTVEVSDDGCGLPEWTAHGGPAPPIDTGGTGLRSMEERAGALGGRLSLGGRDGGGTQLLLELPLDRRGDGAVRPAPGTMGAR